jgi:hypothetical protein
MDAPAEGPARTSVSVWGPEAPKRKKSASAGRTCHVRPMAEVQKTGLVIAAQVGGLVCSLEAKTSASNWRLHRMAIR